MRHTLIIGLEVHVQLQTRTKLFCGCVNRFAPDDPNTQTCPVCTGTPGALPVMNRRAFDLALETALAINCDISAFTKWDRKQYYYPDLPKAYQISQFDLPFSHDGWLEVEVVGEDETESETVRVGIIRAHLEEDAGKNLHDESGRGGDSRVDLNRCGTPLVEIVTEPDIRSAAAARVFLEELRLLLIYLDVSDCNMQEGSLRCDANVNLHIDTDDGHRIATPIVEVKNLNSFRAVEAAILFEERRQIEEWKKAGLKLGDPGVAKETRGWDANRNITLGQRGKEEASDYRYFPDPDLIPVTVTDDFVQTVRESLCEFPADRRKRFCEGWQLSAYDAAVLIDQGMATADYFETVAQACNDAKQAANWVTQDVLRELKERDQSIGEFAISPNILGGLLSRFSEGVLTVKSAREVFATLLEEADNDADISADRIDAIIEEKGLATVSDTGQLEGVIASVVEKNEKVAADFRSGKQAAIGRLIGEVMREIKGADAKVVRQMLIERIEKA
jgi:aspartyl-tRNA(Asn)/glutamyl-tRNA(Gln) amidotransferase subunit B